jgi:ankyrin repeat protein
LEWFKNGVVDIEGGDGRVVMSVPLVSQLTNQRDKHSGSTPLHLAAARSSFPFQKLGREIRLLLDANESTAYQPDNKGLYPIHVAAWSGRLNVVKALLGKCPECATLRDAKGRTFLHVAIVRKKRNVVKYVCSQSDSQAELSSVLNAQDINGDTPLHHAVDVGEIDVFNCLLENPRVRLDVANKEAMTPVDLSITKISSQFHYTLVSNKLLTPCISLSLSHTHTHTHVRPTWRLIT